MEHGIEATKNRILIAIRRFDGIINETQDYWRDLVADIRRLACSAVPRTQKTPTSLVA